MKHRGVRFLGGCALALLLGAGPLHARDEQVDVIGCARDISGSPVRGASVELNGTNYQGGDTSRTTTEWDGTFKLRMKKGTGPKPTEAMVTVWSTIAGQRIRDRGGIGERPVTNAGEAVVRIPACITVSGSYFIGGVVSGKDPTPREGSAVLRLKLTTQNPQEVAFLDLVSHGGYEFSPWFAAGTGYTVSIERQPDGENCGIVNSPAGITGQGDIIDRVRLVQAVNLVCKPVEQAPKPPAAEAPPDLGALPTRPGAGLGNSLASDAIARADQQQRLREAEERRREEEERFRRLTATPSAELDAECARRGSAIGTAGVQAARQRKALFEGMCAKASQASVQIADADRLIAAEAEAERRRAAAEADRQARQQASAPRMSCESAVNSLTGPANQGRPPVVGPGFTQAQMHQQDVWIMQAYLRAANSLPQCTNDPGIRQRIAAMLQTTQQNCRQMAGAGANCESGRNTYVNESQLQSAVQSLMGAGGQAAAAAPAPAPASPAQAAASPGGTCAPDPGLLQTYIEAQNAWARQTSGTMRPMTQQDAIQKFAEYNRRFVASRDVRSLRENVTDLRRQVSESRGISRMTSTETRIFLQIQECELANKESQTAQSRPPAATSSSAPASGNCEAEYARQEAEFTRINQRRPGSASTVPSSQTTMYMIRERLALLDRACRNHPRYAEYGSMRQTYNNTLDVCRRSATSPSDCVPRLAW